MDAEETVDWIERRCSAAAVAEWAFRTMCQKEHWDTDELGATSEVTPRRSHTKATETGRGKQGGYSTLRTRTRESSP